MKQFIINQDLLDEVISGLAAFGGEAVKETVSKLTSLQESSSTTIEVCRRLGDWHIVHGKERRTFHAQIKDAPGFWGCGLSVDEAIGALINSHPEIFNINIKYLGDQYR